MLWIAMLLPELPLQVSHRGLLPDLPLVVCDHQTQRPLVLCANPLARNAGIVPGMAVAAARALVDGLIVQEQDPAREQAALHALAGWALQFTPTVTLEPDGVLLEVQPSLRLFGGLARLGKRLEQGAAQLGFAVSISVAPTPLAARLFALARLSQPALRGSTALPRLAAKLAPLPLALFDWLPETVATLAQLGVTTIGQLRDLPRDGVIHRFGRQPLDDLDRADGSVPDPRVTFAPPPRFYSRIELAAELDRLDWVLLPVQQLLAELEGYLRARQHGTQALRLVFEQGRDRQFTVDIALGAPGCRADDFMRLVRERLDRCVLEAPVQAIALAVDALQPYVPPNRLLVADAASQSLAWRQLCDRLTARLPAEQVYRLTVGNDHRPERASCRHTDLQATTRQRVSVPVSDIDVLSASRPTWLLPSPRPLPVAGGQPQFGGHLTLLTEPERIEAGWWDDDPVSRDYYIARNPRGQLCWVYRDHAAGHWYLHGLFG
ncbi:MAG: Y-family DNA polymerase [Burkholderiaceae bacterium]